MTASDEAAAFPALAAIFSRRSRRFPLGGSLTGPLAYTSDAKPLPLSEEEEAILVAAATADPTIEDAVDFVVGLRWGEQGTFTGDGLTPWTDPAIVARIPRPGAEAVAATKTMARYIWDSYGRFPATIDPFLTTVCYQAHHLDIGFYDRFYPAEAVPGHIRTHLARWHP